MFEAVFVVLLALTLPACGVFDTSSSGGGTTPAASGCADPSPASGFPSGVDCYEGDDSAATASSIAVGDPVQVRTIYPVQDTDWVAVTLTGGVTYELFTTNLNETGDTEIFLYDTDGSTYIDEDDDYVDYDSHLEFTPAVDGTYYLKVAEYEYEDYPGIVSYSLGVLEYVDGDGDEFSPFYDCDDTDDEIYPDADETAGNGIDENCSGTDELVGTTADGAESDNVYTDAVAMVEAGGSYEEIQYRFDIYSGNARTIHTAGDVDFFVVTIPAQTLFEFDRAQNNLSQDVTIYDSDGTTVLDTDSGSFGIENDSASSHTYYISYEAANGTDTGYYVPYYDNYGTDADDDGYYTQDWQGSRDCDDSDPAIYDGATETIGDGIDSNCDGSDDT